MIKASDYWERIFSDFSATTWRSFSLSQKATPWQQSFHGGIVAENGVSGREWCRFTLTDDTSPWRSVSGFLWACRLEKHFNYVWRTGSLHRHGRPCGYRQIPASDPHWVEPDVGSAWTGSVPSEPHPIAWGLWVGRTHTFCNKWAKFTMNDDG